MTMIVFVFLINIRSTARSSFWMTRLEGEGHGCPRRRVACQTHRFVLQFLALAFDAHVLVRKAATASRDRFEEVKKLRCEPQKRGHHAIRRMPKILLLLLLSWWRRSCSSWLMIIVIVIRK